MNVLRSWPVHNIVAHPLMQILNWLGMPIAAAVIHDSTLPHEDTHLKDEVAQQ
jgi:hypothetical protein